MNDSDIKINSIKNYSSSLLKSDAAKLNADLLKDYKITDVSTVSNSISSSSGTNISYLLKNNISYSTLNPGFISKKGNFINFNNAIETPTSSSNGFVRNILTLKNTYVVLLANIA